MNPGRVNLIGLIPAAGCATRFLSLPKYLFPVGNSYLLKTLCDRMRGAGAWRLLIGANPGNYSLLSKYAPEDASVYDVTSKTMSETVLAARMRAGTPNNIIFGMPDTYWTDETVFPRLAMALVDGATVAAAVFKTRPGQHRHIGMVDVQFYDDDLVVRRVVDKPEQTNLHFGWGALAWTADFWQYIDPADPHVGFAVQRAIENRVTVAGVLATGDYWDVGTPEGYYECIREVSGVKV